MAALRSPLVPSPPRSPPQVLSHTPMLNSDNHIASPLLEGSSSPRSADSLAPPSPYPQFVDPSPTESNGTDTTEIDEEAQEGTPTPDKSAESQSRPMTEKIPNGSAVASPTSPSNLARIDTAIDAVRHPNGDDAPQSVIHVPQGFKHFDSAKASPSSPGARATRRSENWIASPSTPDAAKGPDDKRLSGQSQSPGRTDEMTTGTPVRPAQPVRQDSVTDEKSPSTSPQSNRASDHTDSIVINVDGDLTVDGTADRLDNLSSEMVGLRAALSECWNLCNTLANLSAGYRRRVFSTSPDSELQETAWKSCWMLCQELYESQAHPLTNIERAIELCRKFTQSRFEARARPEPVNDSLIRVSFDLNTHLYNLRDRSLPPAFIKRTMDFYVALCHRMMKQRSSLPRETDLLLKACWALAESLYNLQHSATHENEEEYISAAVQACWDLSDVFRDGWTQIRPDRGTPRPTQTQFSARTRAALAASEGRTSSLSNRTYHDAASFPHPEPPLPPETPVTVFDDTTGPPSPEVANVPNILVLGPDHTDRRSSNPAATHHDRWSSNASSLSDTSEGARSSQRSTSTTTITELENRHLRLLRALLLKAAMQQGFQPLANFSPTPSDGDTQSTAARMQAFVASLPRESFGRKTSDLQLFEHYRNLVLFDQSLNTIDLVIGHRYSVVEVARAVRWLVEGNRAQWSWVRQLYERVVGLVGVQEKGSSSSRGGGVAELVF